jgi:hypothetical protein
MKKMMWILEGWWTRNIFVKTTHKVIFYSQLVMTTEIILYIYYVILYSLKITKEKFYGQQNKIQFPG